MYLTGLVARKILNSRKEETIAVIVESNKIKAEASAPSGKSKGRHEVKDFSSRGIDFSVSFLNVLGKKLINEKIKFESFEDLEKIEELVKKHDHTKNLSFIGGNALYALEAAILKAIAASQGKELWQFLYKGKGKPKIPKLLGNCIGGGVHVRQEKRTDFQEFLLMPNTKLFFDAYFINLQAYNEAKKILAEKDKAWKRTLTDENALAATINNEAVLELLQEIKQKIKDKFDIELKLGIDIAASSFWNAGKYRYKNFSKTNKENALTKEKQIAYIAELAKKYSIIYLEDPLHEEDFEGFHRLRKKLHRVLVCGDDLTCTNTERVKEAIKTRAISALIIKPNQIGSLIETKKVLDLAKEHKIITIISHRSGETMDNMIAHLAIGWQIPIIKTGILGKERLAKLNELLRIEKEIR